MLNELLVDGIVQALDGVYVVGGGGNMLHLQQLVVDFKQFLLASLQHDITAQLAFHHHVGVVKFLQCRKSLLLFFRANVLGWKELQQCFTLLTLVQLQHLVSIELWQDLFKPRKNLPLVRLGICKDNELVLQYGDPVLLTFLQLSQVSLKEGIHLREQRLTVSLWRVLCEGYCQIS